MDGDRVRAFLPKKGVSECRRTASRTRAAVVMDSAVFVIGTHCALRCSIGRFCRFSACGKEQAPPVEIDCRCNEALPAPIGVAVMQAIRRLRIADDPICRS